MSSLNIKLNFSDILNQFFCLFSPHFSCIFYIHQHTRSLGHFIANQIRTNQSWSHTNIFKFIIHHKRSVQIHVNILNAKKKYVNVIF